MGGYGSGRWRCHTPRETVDRSLTLDANQLMLRGIVRAGADGGGVLRCGEGGLRYHVTTGNDSGGLAIVYGVEGQVIAQRIDLESSRPPLGGLRWWFLCPLTDCGRRVVTLHLPPGQSRFACRSCHDLTYASCQAAHTLDKLFSEMAAASGPGWTVSLMRRYDAYRRGPKFGRKRFVRLVRDLAQAGVLRSDSGRDPAAS